MSIGLEGEERQPDATSLPPTLHTDVPLPAERLIEFCRREARFQRLRAAEAEDVVQEALVALLLRLDSIQDPLAYLRVVIRRKAAFVRRSSWLATEREASPHRTAEGRHDPWVHTDGRLDSIRAWRALGSPDRQLISLVCSGRTYAEIGAKLGCSPGAARVRVFRIRQRVSNSA